MSRTLALAGALTLCAVAPAGAAFPGGNGKILYTTYPGTQIVSVEPDGGNPQVLADGRAGHWSPDGRRIAYMNANNVWLMTATGAAQDQITTGKIVNSLDWSPDGRHLLITVYDTVAGGSGRIEVIDLDGNLVRTIANVPRSASWSPDGDKIAYSGLDNTIRVVRADGSGEISSFPGLYPEWSPDGKRITFTSGFSVATAKPDGTNQTTFGGGGQWSTYSPDGTRIAFLRPHVDGTKVLTVAATGGDEKEVAGGGALLPHWQPTRRPIVFVPGFAASEITCGSSVLWLSRPFPPLLDMRLAADGVSNLGESECGAAAGPNGKLLIDPLGVPIGTGVNEFLRKIAPDDFTMFGWDWRKSPVHALAGLDAAIERARCGGVTPPCADPVEKVVLVGHSMGGLVIRAYIDDAVRAAKVARAVTVGTPYWGSPKAVFPLAAGVEAPHFSDLDVILDNGDFQAFAKNLAGMYTLYPSGNYGSWLTLLHSGGAPVDQSGVLGYVGDAGGNPDLLNAAFALHASTLDGFKTNGVNFQVFAGAGKTTIERVAFNKLSLLTDGVIVEYGNGDETVPLRSAVQGTPGGSDPLGEDVPIHYSCGIGHVALINDPAVTSRIRSFLLGGFAVEPSGGPCAAAGHQLVFQLEVAGRQASSARAAADTSGLEAEERAGRLQVIDTGDQKLVVAEDSVPTEFSFSADRFTLSVTPLTDGVKGDEVVYGPLSGTFTVRTGATVSVSQADVVVPPDPQPGLPDPPATMIAAPVAPPRITSLRVRPSRFRPARRGGSVVRRGSARVTYSLTAAARVRFTVERRVRVKGRTRFRRVKGSFTHAGRAGANAIRFSGRLARRRLAAGRYRLVANSGQSSRRAAFTVVR